MKIIIFSLSVFIFSVEALQANVTLSSRALSTTCDSTLLNNYCYGSLNLNAEGIWVRWDNQKTSPPNNAVDGGSDSYGRLYVMRAQYGNNGIVVGKYSPALKSAWVPYGGTENGGFTTFDVLRHTNSWWGEVTEDATKWIPGGIDPSGNIVYICQVALPTSVSSNQYVVPGKFHNGRCFIPYGGVEHIFDTGFKVLRQSLL